MQNLPDLKKIFFSPREFFNSISNENDFLQPWLIVVIASVIYYVIIQLLSITKTFLVNPSLGMFSIMFAFLGLVIFVPVMLAAPFIGAGVVYLGALILGVRDTFIKTFKVMCYGGIVGLIYNLIIQLLSLPSSIVVPENAGIFTPSMLLFTGLIVIIALAGLVHQFYIEIHGLSLYFNISKIRAFFSIILIPLAFLIIVALFILLIWVLIQGNTMMTGNFVADLPNMVPTP